MKRMVKTLLAVSVVLSSGCTVGDIAQVMQLLDSVQAELELTQTDDNGLVSAIKQNDVVSMELDGRSIAATYASNGHLRLPAGDYSQDRDLVVRLRDGSLVTLPLNRRTGTTRGERIEFTG